MMHRTIDKLLTIVALIVGFTISGSLLAATIGDEAQKCIDCHKKNMPAVVADWQKSQHAEQGVSCLDCHVVPKDSPMGTSHPKTDHKVSVLVPPSVCGECHATEVEEFNASGHFRAYRQQIPKDSLHALTSIHEGREHAWVQLMVHRTTPTGMGSLN